MNTLQRQLFDLQDLKYREFHSKLMPGIAKETIIGIRTPVLRNFVKEFRKTDEAKLFLAELPHQYYEENNIHMMLIAQIRDYETCIAEVNRFLPSCPYKKFFHVLVGGLCTQNSSVKHDFPSLLGRKHIGKTLVIEKLIGLVPVFLCQAGKII